MGDYFMTHIISSFIDSLILAIPFGLIWVLGLYNLENKKGRIILLAVYVTMILIPIVTFIGSFSVVNDWITHGTLDNLINATTSSSMRSELFSISQWTGPTGIILLLSQLLNSILVFVALYIPYKRIITGELKPNLPTAPTKA
jgi:hypothetical protein